MHPPYIVTHRISTGCLPPVGMGSPHACSRATATALAAPQSPLVQAGLEQQQHQDTKTEKRRCRQCQRLKVFRRHNIDEGMELDLVECLRGVAPGTSAPASAYL
jgi:hypothetical protein